MRRIAALFLGAALAATLMIGCGKNPCEEACDKFKECNYTTSTVSCTGDCPTEYEAMMKCYAGLTCDQLKDYTKVLECASKK